MWDGLVGAIVGGPVRSRIPRWRHRQALNLFGGMAPAEDHATGSTVSPSNRGRSQPGVGTVIAWCVRDRGRPGHVLLGGRTSKRPHDGKSF